MVGIVCSAHDLLVCIVSLMRTRQQGRSKHIADKLVEHGVSEVRLIHIVGDVTLSEDMAICVSPFTFVATQALFAKMSL